jgi:hypothetical protein
MNMTGFRFSKSDFYFHELTTGYDPALLARVLAGDIVGVIFRGYISQKICAEIAARFTSSAALGRRMDGVPASYVGAYHYRKRLSDYLSEAEECREEVGRIMGDAGNERLRMAFSELANYFGGGAIVRVARHDRRDACPLAIRTWANQGEYALSAHEDYSQCSDPDQAEFEVQRGMGDFVVAANGCVASEPGDGSLVIWNIRPDDQTKDRLGLRFLGYPYEIRDLEGEQKLSIQITTGDLYFFNAALVHAVSSIRTTGSRVTFSWLMRRHSGGEILLWT